MKRQILNEKTVMRDLSIEEIEALQDKLDVKDAKKVLKIYKKNPERFTPLEKFIESV